MEPRLQIEQAVRWGLLVERGGLIRTCHSILIQRRLKSRGFVRRVAQAEQRASALARSGAGERRCAP